MVVFANRYAVLVLNVVSLTAIARLVTPAETGLFSVAASIVLLAQALRDFGIAEFLVQEKELTDDKIRTAFGLNLLLAWSLGAVIFFLRNWIVEVYQAPELGRLVAIGCLSFLVAPFSSTILALLNRDMNFVALMKVSVLSSLVGLVVSVGAAALGGGATALSLGMLASNVTTAVTAGFLLPSWEHLIPSLREWRRLSAFGLFISGTNLANQLGARVPELVLGRLLGFAALGQFNRSRGIVFLFYELIVSSVNTVAFPALSSAHREGHDLREPYIRCTTLVSGTVLPVLAVFSLVADPFIRVAFGPNWVEAARMAPLLAMGAGIAVLAPISSQVLSATGQVRLLLRLTLLTQLSLTFFMAAFSVFGLMWLAFGLVLHNIVALVLTADALRRCIGLQLGQLLRASVPSIGLTVGSTIVPALFLLWRKSFGDLPLFTLACVAALATVSYLFCAYAFRHPVTAEIAVLLRQTSSVLRRRPRAVVPPG